MDAVKEFKNDVLKKDVAVLFIGALICIAIPSGNEAVFRGLILGNLSGLLCFMLMSSAVERAALMEPGRARAHMLIGYVSRYIIYGVVLYAAFKSGLTTGLGASAGLVLLRLPVVLAGLGTGKGGAC